MSILGMEFANPNALWLLLVFPPALAAFFWWAQRRRQELMALFIRARLLPGLISGLSPTRQKVRLAGIVIAVGLLIVALARPQWGFVWEEVQHRGLDIVVAIDVSKSMLAEDIAPNRLERAKLAALDLMQQAKSDRLGLVAFAGSAFLECPLTIDDSAFRQSVDALDVNSISQGGTAIADAIEAALGAFKEGDNYKVLVLFTDGEDQDSGALEAAKKAAQQGLRIFTVGIGTTEGAMVQIVNSQGQKDFIRDEHDNAHKSHLNEELLREISGATEGGFYLPLRANTIDMLYAKGLAPLPKSQSQEKLVKRLQERYQWPLGLALLLLALEMIIPERSRERSSAPAVTPGPERRGQASPNGTNRKSPPLDARGSTQNAGWSAEAAAASKTALLLFALLLAPGLLRGSPSRALREYKSGQYQEALKEYDRLLESKSDDPRLRFDAGAAAYRAQQLEEAAKHFDEALSTPDLTLQQQAYYNRGNTFYYLGDRNPDPSKKSEIWEKSLKDFESSLKLNPQDADAKYNYQYVKKRLEELKQQQQQQKNQQKQDKDQQQQQQQNQQQQSQDQNQDKNQQQQQQQQQQSSKQDQAQNKDQSGQKQDASQQNQQPQSAQQKEEDQKQQQAQQKQSQDQTNQQQQAQQAQASSEGQTNEENQESAAYAQGQMTPEQARQLLDAQKGDDMMLQAKAPQKPVDPNKPIRDW